MDDEDSEAGRKSLPELMNNNVATPLEPDGRLFVRAFAVLACIADFVATFVRLFGSLVFKPYLLQLLRSAR